MQVPPNPKDTKKAPPIPEMVGATSAPFPIGAGASNVSFIIHPATGPALLRSDMTMKQVFLHVDNLTSEINAPPFKVYLNVPTGESPERHPELYAGLLSTFGLVESTRSKERHPDNGLSFNLDVTKVFHLLAANRDWDHKTLQVTFVATSWDAPVPKVQVGRVSLYFS